MLLRLLYKQLITLSFFAIVYWSSITSTAHASCSNSLKTLLEPVTNTALATNRMAEVGFVTIDIPAIEDHVVESILAEAGAPNYSIQIGIRNEFSKQHGDDPQLGAYAPWSGLFGLKYLSAENLKHLDDYVVRIEDYLNAHLATLDQVKKYQAYEGVLIIEGINAGRILTREPHTHPTGEIDVVNSIRGLTTIVHHRGMSNSAPPNTTLLMSGDKREQRLNKLGINVKATLHESPYSAQNAWRVFFFCSFKRI